MDSIEEYIEILRERMIKQGYNLELIIEYSSFLKNEFEDFKTETDLNHNEKDLEKLFVNKLEDPIDIAEILGKPMIPSHKEIFLRLLPLYFFLIGVFFFLLSYEHLLLDTILEGLWYSVSWGIGAITMLIWWITPLLVIIYFFRNIYKFNKMFVLKYGIILYFYVVILFLLQILLVFVSHFIIGGHFRTFVLWVPIFIMFVIWRRSIIRHDLNNFSQFLNYFKNLKLKRV